jgi:hypothetical protein
MVSIGINKVDWGHMDLEIGVKKGFSNRFELNRMITEKKRDADTTEQKTILTTDI